MDNIFAELMKWQTGVFGLTIYAVTLVIRKIVEASAPSVKTSIWWSEVFLSLAPIVNGVWLVFALPFFPWPTPVAASLGLKVLYGMVCGLVSGWLYGRAKSLVDAIKV